MPTRRSSGFYFASRKKSGCKSREINLSVLEDQDEPVGKLPDDSETMEMSIVPCCIMSKTSSLTSKDVIKLLEQHGFELNRVNGSHHYFVHPVSER